MELRQLTVAETAKRMAEILDEKFNAVNLSHYRAGRSLPQKKYLAALSAVLEVQESELMPATRSDEIAIGNRFDIQSVPQFKIEELSNGYAYLQINQELPWPVVIRVIEALKSASRTRENGIPDAADDDDGISTRRFGQG